MRAFFVGDGVVLVFGDVEQESAEIGGVAWRPPEAKYAMARGGSLIG